MIAFLLVSLCCGPLVVAVACLAVAGFVGTGGVAVPQGVWALCAVLVALQLAAAGGVSVLYRWCFLRPAVRGAGLFAALCASILAFTYPPILEPLAAVVNARGNAFLIGTELVQLFIAMFTVVAIGVIGCMTAVVVAEVPLRWVQGDRLFLSDGTYRFLRSVGVGVVLVAASAAIQERATAQLIDALGRVLG